MSHASNQRAAWRQQLQQAAQQLIHLKVSRVRRPPQVQDTEVVNPDEAVETTEVRAQKMKRKPESTTEELEDGAQNEADADTKMLGKVCEEPMITSGLDGDSLAECEAAETQEDVNGSFLVPDLAREAPLKESGGYRDMQVYCPVTVVNQDGGLTPAKKTNVLLVAKEVGQLNTEEESANFFGSTPPREAVNFLISETTTQKVSRNKRPLKLSFIDVQKRHICARKCRESRMSNPPA